MTDVATEALLIANLDRATDRFYGKYRGLVADTQDSTNRGRIRATVPEVLGDTQTGWALPCVPYAGENCGYYAVPPVGAGVWIEFEAGDVSRPVWVGAWWGTGEAPLDFQSRAPDPLRNVWRSPKGMQLTLDDANDTIAISDSGGKNQIVVKVIDETIEVRAAGRVVLEAPEIAHGEGASQAAVLGDELKSYLEQLVKMFNQHVHPGQSNSGGPVSPAPPSPSLTPPSSSLLSTKNSVE